MSRCVSLPDTQPQGMPEDAPLASGPHRTRGELRRRPLPTPDCGCVAIPRGQLALRPFLGSESLGLGERKRLTVFRICEPGWKSLSKEATLKILDHQN